MPNGANDNGLYYRQRIRTLEASIGNMQRDLARIDRMLRLTPTKPRLRKQKGAIEKVIVLAQVEIGKLRERAD